VNVKPPDFIMMLTHRDATVSNAADLVSEIVAAGVSHMGFKDVGLPFPALRDLAKQINDLGCHSYLEVVSETADAERRSLEAALELGVDYVMGGTNVDVAGPILAGTDIRYYPFPGNVVGHPSVLLGPHDDIVQSSEDRASRDWVVGLDLLAYRFAGDVPTLIRDVVAASGVPVVVAGSIDSATRIGDVARSGAAGFTIGSAILDGSLAIDTDDRTPGGLCRAVLDHVERTAA
jgi:hypothetical protein